MENDAKSKKQTLANRVLRSAASVVTGFALASGVPFAAQAAEKQNPVISLGDSFGDVTVKVNGVRVEVRTDGSVVAYRNGTAEVKKSTPANDTAVAAVKAVLESGAKMADGSVFAGMTADGKQQIFAMPTDLGVTMTFNDAAKRVKKLNSQKALGHDDWQIPSLGNVRVLYKNQNEGALKGTFKTCCNKGRGPDFPDWYWSSTGHPDHSSHVHGVRFSDGAEDWLPNVIKLLSCRPVRLVKASAPAPAPR